MYILTETYKPDTDNTKDHTDLVEAFIKAFIYESNIVYKNGSNKAMYLNNEAAHKSGTVYVGEPKTLSVDSVGLNGAKWITSNYKKGHVYTKTYEEIKFQIGTDERTDDHLGIDTNKAEANTDSRWKNILEGYTESGTIDSYKGYKYREYVKAWITGIPLGDHTNAYKRLGTLEGISELDRINIKVVGSKSDDIRFSNQ